MRFDKNEKHYKYAFTEGEMYSFLNMYERYLGYLKRNIFNILNDEEINEYFDLNNIHEMLLLVDYYFEEEAASEISESVCLGELIKDVLEGNLFGEL